MSSKYSSIEKNLVKNSIFEFLNHNDLSTILNLNKNSRLVIEKYQNNFIKYLQLIRKMKQKNIRTVPELVEEIDLLNEVYKEEEIFQDIFYYLFKSEEYDLNFEHDGKNMRECLFMCHALKKNVNLKRLNIRFMNEISYLLEEILKMNNKITYIKFLYIFCIDLHCFREGIIKNKSITHLNMNGNQFLPMNYDFTDFKEGISENESITHLYLIGNRIGDYPENFKIFSDAIKNHRSLTHLYLMNNYLGNDPENMKIFSEILKNNKSISFIDLMDNNIGSHPDDMMYLSEGLKHNRSIKFLHLSSNKIGSNPDDTKYLVEAVMNNETISEIHVGNNKVGTNNKDFSYLAELEKKNKNLQIIF